MPNHSYAQTISVSGGSIFTTVAGTGPPLLLLHGFPQTHLMWRDVAPLLASEFTVICADLRGYGASACPPSTPDHLPYSKRAMAAEMVELMEKFGFSEFMIGGHDRGGRDQIAGRRIRCPLMAALLDTCRAIPSCVDGYA
jgi:haloacetate dehalogenase